MANAAAPLTAWQLVGRGAFARFFWAGFVSSVGDWAALFAQIALADAIAGPTGILVVLAARLLPGLIGGAIGGVLADRVNRKVAIVAADVGRGLVVLSLAFVESLTALFVISVLLELLTLMGQPARAAAVANLVNPANLLTANSLVLGAAYGTFPFGAALTWLLGLAPAITLFGLLPDTAEARVFAVDAVTFLLSGALVATIGFGRQRLTPERQKRSRFDWRAPLRDLVDGVVFVARDRRVRAIILGMSLALFGSGMLVVLGRSFASDVLAADEAGFFALLTALGTGAAAGIIALSFYEDRIIHRDAAFGISLTITGIALAVAATVDTVAGAMGWLVVMGLGAGSAYVTGFTHLHEQVEDDLQGRTFAALFSLMRVGLLVSMAVAAPAAEYLDGRLAAPFENATRDLLFLGGMITTVAGAGTLWSLRHLFTHPKMTAEGLESLHAAGRFFFRRRGGRGMTNGDPVEAPPPRQPGGDDD